MTQKENGKSSKVRSKGFMTRKGTWTVFQRNEKSLENNRNRRASVRLSTKAPAAKSHQVPPETHTMEGKNRLLQHVHGSEDKCAHVCTHRNTKHGFEKEEFLLKILGSCMQKLWRDMETTETLVLALNTDEV